MKKLSKSEMKKFLGGQSARAGCGSICYYFSGGFLRASTCVFRFVLNPLPPAIPPPSCVCQATGAACWDDVVVV